MNVPQGDRTPVFEQYMAIKSRHPDSVMFYRMGDFYEMFYEDAQIASEVLGLRLTSRAHGKAGKVPLAGFPYHQLDGYLTRMVESGRRVVIVEQVEDPKKAKGLVKRDVVKVVTAGTNFTAVDREELTPNRIASLIKSRERWGVAWTDVVTGEFYAGEFASDELRSVLGTVSPVELVVPEGSPEIGPVPSGRCVQPIVSKLVDWVWEPAFARKTLLDHFATAGLKGFGIEHLTLAVSAAGALLHYLKGNLRTDPSHLTSLSRADVQGKLVMESTTRRHLELFESLSGNPQATLFAIMDRTLTGPGRRLLSQRLIEPLSDRERLVERLDAVGELLTTSDMKTRLRTHLKGSGDIQRNLARLVTGRGSGRDLVVIRDLLGLIPQFLQALAAAHSTCLQATIQSLDPLPDLFTRLTAVLKDDPPLATAEGGIIREGFDAEVDQLRIISQDGKSWLMELERKERARTGIPNLKIGYNRVVGYFIEITKSQLAKAPSDYQRRATLVNAERFLTPELQDFESKVLTAEETLCQRETELFQQLVALTLTHSAALQENARALAELDLYCSLAILAEAENYIRPTLTDDDRITLRESRHPVVERMMPPGEQFVPNDLEVGGHARILIITGPNMAGKSTYLRQVALSVIMAQMGSFVPAKEATIGLVDKLFTRIGALDNLAGGESTFMVEMQETAAILHNATPRSLVLFDEVGRGTSTFDGLSLAWSIIEYLHENQKLRPRTLFATHFHELVELEKYLSGVKNLNVAVRECNDRVIFIRKIVPGGCDRSFGIHVAMMAGIPPEVVSRAREVLRNLEANDLKPVNGAVGKGESSLRNESATSDDSEVEPTTLNRQEPSRHIAQLSFFDPVEHKLRDLLINVDPDQMTPVEALNLIATMKREIEPQK